jgi:hypothetical protein
MAIGPLAVEVSTISVLGRYLLAAVIVFESELSSLRATTVSTAFGKSYQVNVSGAGQNIAGDAANEPSMCISPIDPNHMAIGWRQFDSTNSNFRQAGVAYTTKGGLNWTFPGKLEPGTFHSDPVLASDADGVFLLFGHLEHRHLRLRSAAFDKWRNQLANCGTGAGWG